MKTLPNKPEMRYHYPITSGCLAYFPAALAGVAKHSYIGGAKYNDGGLVHLRYMSPHHIDCIGRHLLDLLDLQAMQARGVTEVPTWIYNFEEKTEELLTIPIGEAILIECNALAWRSLAVSQIEHEKMGKPLAPAARTEPPAPPVKPIKLLSFGKNKVPVVKALRDINAYTLKDAVDLVNGIPSTVNYRSSHFSREKAVQRLIDAGANAE
jgi:ribosomal protein L7/L12